MCSIYCESMVTIVIAMMCDIDDEKKTQREHEGRREMREIGAMYGCIVVV